MKKLIKLLIITSLLVLLPLSMFACKGDETTDEYRHLTTLTDVKAAPLSEKASVLNEYIDDNMPARQDLNRIVGSVSLFAGVSPNDDVVKGKEDWLYLTDSVKWHTDEINVDEEILSRFIANITDLTTKLKAMDCEPVIFIAPDKLSVYPEFVPDSIRLTSSNTEAIIKALKQEGIIVIFPREELIMRKPDYPLFAKYDTHWLSTGAYIATNILVNSLGSTNPPIDELAMYPRDCTGNDLARLINMADVIPAETDYDYVGYGLGRSGPNLTGWDARGDGKSFHTEGACEKEIYVLHDSFWEAMEPFFTIAFSDSFTRHFDNYVPGEIYSHSPDILLIEVCERSLLRLSDIDF